MFGIFDYRLIFADDARLRRKIAKYPTVLLYCLRKGHHDVALRLIQLDVSCCDVVDRGETPLLYACRNNLPVIASAILGADPTGGRSRVHHVDSEGRTATFWACNPQKPMLEVFVRLMKMEGVDFKRVDNAGDSILSLAIKRGLHVSPLVSCGRFDLLHVDRDGDTLLMTAIRNSFRRSDPDLITTLLAQPDILRNVGHVNKAGETALIIAVSHGPAPVTVVSQLLATGQALPLHRDRAGRHALFHAIRGGFPTHCHVLLDTGLYNPYDRDRWGESLLELACRRTLYDVIARLSDNNVTLLKKVHQDVEDERRREEERRLEEERQQQYN